MANLTHSEGIAMLPTGPIRVVVEELFDDAGKPAYMIKIKSIQGAEFTVGRRRNQERAETEAQALRDHLPGMDAR